MKVKSDLQSEARENQRDIGNSVGVRMITQRIRVSLDYIIQEFPDKRMVKEIKYS
jgi:hypothetical protein